MLATDRDIFCEMGVVLRCGSPSKDFIPQVFDRACPFDQYSLFPGSLLECNRNWHACIVDSNRYIYGWIPYTISQEIEYDPAGSPACAAICCPTSSLSQSMRASNSCTLPSTPVWVRAASIPALLVCFCMWFNAS